MPKCVRCQAPISWGNFNLLTRRCKACKSAPAGRSPDIPKGDGHCRWCTARSVDQCGQCKWTVCGRHFVILETTYEGPGPSQTYRQRCCGVCANSEKQFGLIMIAAGICTVVYLTFMVKVFGNGPLAYFGTFLILLVNGLIGLGITSLPTRNWRLGLLLPWISIICLILIVILTGLILQMSGFLNADI